MKSLIMMCCFLTAFIIQSNDVKDIFTNIYQTKYWGDGESVSGSGSTLKQTIAIRIMIPKLLQILGVKSLLDIPCGDFNWMKEVDRSFLRLYIGMDICDEIVKNNQEKHQDDVTIFFAKDLLTDDLPKVDLILCRDCLQHLTFDQVKQAVRNMKRSGSMYLLTTTYIQWQKNINIQTGEFNPINVNIEPFNFPNSLYIFNEGATDCNNKVLGKSLGLWRLKDLPDYTV